MSEANRSIRCGMRLMLFGFVVCSASGCWSVYVVLDYVQITEMVVGDRNGEPVPGVRVYQSGWPERVPRVDYVAIESRVAKRHAGLFADADHTTDEAGVCAIPIFDTHFCHRLAFPGAGLIFPCELGEEGAAGKTCLVRVEADEEDEISVVLRPGSMGEGERYVIQITSLQVPRRYDVSDCRND